jgi:ABC-type uncharacterized transport system substrate-binding protein
MHTFILVIFLVLGYAFQAMAWAGPAPTVALVANSSHLSMLHRIESALYSQAGPRPKLVEIDSDTVQNPDQFIQPNHQPFHLIVAAGANATEAVLATKTSIPILSILIRKSTYENLIYQFSSNVTSAMPNITAIYLDQPLTRQLNLIECLLPDISKNRPIGLMLGPTSLHYARHFQNEAIERNLDIQIMQVKAQDNPVAMLNMLVEEAKVVLAIPDEFIFNARTARGMLLTASRKRVPLIGFSRTYVNNGALAAVYASPKQIAGQVAKQVVNLTHTDPQLTAPQYPEKFSVAVNYQVARSLGIEIESEAALKYALEQLEMKNGISQDDMQLGLKPKKLNL